MVQTGMVQLGRKVGDGLLKQGEIDAGFDQLVRRLVTGQIFEDTELRPSAIPPQATSVAVGMPWARRSWWPANSISAGVRGWAAGA